MIELDYGDPCPEVLIPMFGRELCSYDRGFGEECALAEGHNSWHASLDSAERVTRSWNWLE